MRRAIERHGSDDEGFFVVTSTEGLDVRDRIATYLDAALFESVIAAEVRRLGSSESFDRLVDLIAHLVSQVTTYRWIAILRNEPSRLGIHSNPSRHDLALSEARTAFRLAAATPPVVSIEDDDAVADLDGPPAIVMPIHFGDIAIGSLALAPRAPVHANDPGLVKIIARELGGALRMATLVEESRLHGDDGRPDGSPQPPRVPRLGQTRGAPRLAIRGLSFDDPPRCRSLQSDK